LDHRADLLVRAAKGDRIQVGGYGCQHIVEVVRNAAGKLAECFQTLRLRQRSLCLLTQRHLALKIAEGRRERPVRVCSLDPRAVERVLQLQDLGRSGGNWFGGLRGHVRKRLAQLFDRPSDLSRQAPGEQEARDRKAGAQDDRPAHRAPSCCLQLRFLDRDTHCPVTHRWLGIGSYERIPRKGGELEHPVSCLVARHPSEAYWPT
jgi:hypothetical protein